MPLWQNGKQVNRADFTYLLQKPEAINQKQTDAIAQIIKEFPYFQSARSLYLKGLKNGFA